MWSMSAGSIAIGWRNAVIILEFKAELSLSFAYSCVNKLGERRVSISRSKRMPRVLQH
jgi:hypothetical protein